MLLTAAVSAARRGPRLDKRILRMTLDPGVGPVSL